MGFVPACLFGLIAVTGCGVSLDPVILRPSSTFRLIPTDLQYPYDEMMLPVKGGSQVSVWHVHAVGTPLGVVVIVPGNDENKGRYSLVLPIFVDKGWDVVLYDYPGFGASPGPATLGGLLDNTRAAFDYAFEQDDVVVGCGVSLGTAVLARIAPEYKLTGCIFESTTNLWEISSQFLTYHHAFEALGGIADLVTSAGTSPDFDFKRWIVEVKAPKLFLHSPDDSVTPFTMAWEIFKLAPQPKHLIATQADHAMQVFIDPIMYRSLINGWLDGVLKRDPFKFEGYQGLLDTELRKTLEAYGLPFPEFLAQ